ncbi:hypothetical protein [Metaplanococcus flavidus]|uniref:Uncharacterized protein n=1 Tax=Metaplanococcus flavidus TaxID=569883 RepID=A0ABW3LFY0_9BACL
MISLIILPMNFFDRFFNADELAVELDLYLKLQLKENNYVIKEVLDENSTVDLKNLKEEEKFYVPTIIIFDYRERKINVIDLIVYVYLCYIAYSDNNSTVKPSKKEISRKINERKTDVEESLNFLVTLGRTLLDRNKSGYYIIDELANQEKVLGLEVLLKKEKHKYNPYGILK